MKKSILTLLVLTISALAIAQDVVPTTPLVKIREMQAMAMFDEVLKEGVNKLSIDAAFCKVEVVACPDTLSNTRVVGKIEAMDAEEGYKINAERKDGAMKLAVVTPENSKNAFAGEFVIYLHNTTQLDISATSGAVKIAGVEQGHVAVQTKGKVNLDKANGTFDVQTIGGQIIGYKVTGNLKVKTNNSLVKLEQSEGEFDLDSGDGALEVSQIKGQLKTNSFGGKQTIDNVEGDLDLNSKGGLIRLTYITANILKATTLRGDVSFGNSIKGVLDITTVSGTISNAQPIILTGSSRFDSESGRIKMKFANKKEELAFDVTADSKDAVISVKGTKKKKKLQMGNGNIIVTSHSVRGEQIFS